MSNVGADKVIKGLILNIEVMGSKLHVVFQILF